MAVELAHRGCEFFDFNELIFGDIREMLTRVCRWPPHVDRDYVRIMSQTDMLLHRL